MDAWRVEVLDERVGAEIAALPIDIAPSSFTSRR
jgi:hypothetical protein